jgi:hypothetical protein
MKSIVVATIITLKCENPDCSYVHYSDAPTAAQVGSQDSPNRD